MANKSTRMEALLNNNFHTRPTSVAFRYLSSSQIEECVEKFIARAMGKDHDDAITCRVLIREQCGHSEILSGMARRAKLPMIILLMQDVRDNNDRISKTQAISPDILKQLHRNMVNVLDRSQFNVKADSELNKAAAKLVASGEPDKIRWNVIKKARRVFCELDPEKVLALGFNIDQDDRNNLIFDFLEKPRLINSRDGGKEAIFNIAISEGIPDRKPQQDYIKDIR